MILTLAVLTVVGLATGRLVARWMSRDRALPLPVTPAAEGAAEAPPAPAPSLAGLPCSLGDVVLLSRGEEAWLAGALVFRERASHRDAGGDADRTIAALFVAPERGVDRAVYARASPSPSLDWMSPLPAGALTVGDEPPSVLEHEGERFQRTRRIPLAVTPVGTGAPDVGADAVIGEYEGGGGARLLVVIGPRARCIWRGQRLEEGMYEVLPGGAGTL